MEFEKFAKTIAKEAGKIIRENFTLGMKKEWKQDDTPLTIADTAINDLVLQKVKSTYPEHGFLGEEGGHFNEKAKYLWVCDPIDGTIPFSHGIPTCVFSLALVEDGQPILGVVYDPFMNRLFFGTKGGGACLNDKPIKVSSVNSPKNAIVGFTIWQLAPKDITEVYFQLHNEGFKVINLYTITYMGALVANGEFVATIWPGSSPWDIAALKVIVEEAGGQVTDLAGNDQVYNKKINGAIISNGLLHDQFTSMAITQAVK